MTREEAIKVVKERLDYYEREKRLKAACEILIPELAESEDERIRIFIQNELVCLRATEIKGSERYNEITSAIAYLEKRKEQMPVDIEQKVRELLYIPKQCVHTPKEIDFADRYSHQVWEKLMAKFNAIEGYRIGANDVSDIVLNAILNTFKFIAEQKPDYCHHEVDLSGCSEEYSKGYYDGWNNCNQQYSQLEAEQKPAECVKDSVKFEEGFKAGRESGLRDGQKYVLNNLDSYGLCKPTGWSEQYIADIFEKVGLAKIVREQENDDLTNALQNAMLELSKVGNAEWSEEDFESLVGELVQDIVANEKDAANYGDKKKPTSFFVKKYSDRLKSLRFSWKPSEQEKGALRTAIHILTDERNFPKAAAHLQNILDAFEGEEPRKEWKPSEEQLEALKYFIKLWGKTDTQLEYTKVFNNVESLYNDLKKL